MMGIFTDKRVYISMGRDLLTEKMVGSFFMLRIFENVNLWIGYQRSRETCFGDWFAVEVRSELAAGSRENLLSPALNSPSDGPLTC